MILNNSLHCYGCCCRLSFFPFSKKSSEHSLDLHKPTTAKPHFGLCWNKQFWFRFSPFHNIYLTIFIWFSSGSSQVHYQLYHSRLVYWLNYSETVQLHLTTISWSSLWYIIYFTSITWEICKKHSLFALFDHDSTDTSVTWKTDSSYNYGNVDNFD